MIAGLPVEVVPDDMGIAQWWGYKYFSLRLTLKLYLFAVTLSLPLPRIGASYLR